MNSIHQLFHSKAQQGIKSWAVLIDPDKTTPTQCQDLITMATAYPPTYFFVGSSLLTQHDQLHTLVTFLKNHTKIPVILFPGNYAHLTPAADALLFLSLISGRNAEYLIGNHVLAAPLVKKYKLPTIPTGYLLIDGGQMTSVGYISNTQPLPNDKIDLAVCTAMAGEFLGLQLIYLEAGSGALYPVRPQMIAAVKAALGVPLIVGGGIRTASEFSAALEAGADIVVTGNILEQYPERMKEFFQCLG